MNSNLMTKQYLLSTAAGKRLIAKAFLQMESIQKALKENTIVITAGTTNGYIGEEILKHLDQDSGFRRDTFFRGITLPPNYKKKSTSPNNEETFPGDLVIINGKWQKGLTIFDVIDDLKQGDIILKGANAVNRLKNQAGIYIGHPKGGTILAAMQAVLGRRVQLYIPVGLEKRVEGDLIDIANTLNASNTYGPRMYPLTGNIYTEIEAMTDLTGARCQLVAGGGVCGAEGSYWLAVTGSEEELNKASSLIKELKEEPNFTL